MPRAATFRRGAPQKRLECFFRTVHRRSRCLPHFLQTRIENPPIVFTIQKREGERARVHFPLGDSTAPETAGPAAEREGAGQADDQDDVKGQTARPPPSPSATEKGEVTVVGGGNLDSQVGLVTRALQSLWGGGDAGGMMMGKQKGAAGEEEEQQRRQEECCMKQ